MNKRLRWLSMMLILVLCLPAAAFADDYRYPIGSAGLFEPFEAADEEFAAANLFLSNFTEVGVDRLEGLYGWYEDIGLVDFAHDHIWFNDQDEYEYGDYFAGNNCRVSDDDIQRIVDKYFYDAPEVDLSQTRFDYSGGYYYHCETGGWTDCGFAHATSIVPFGENRYFVSFMVFGGGYLWDNSMMSASLEEIILEFGEPYFCGSAMVYAENLSDRSTYKLISYSLLR